MIKADGVARGTEELALYAFMNFGVMAQQAYGIRKPKFVDVMDKLARAHEQESNFRFSKDETQVIYGELVELKANINRRLNDPHWQAIVKRKKVLDEVIEDVKVAAQKGESFKVEYITKDSKFVDYSDKPYVKEMLQDYGLLSQNEKPADVLNGRIIASKQIQNRKDLPLVVVRLDKGHFNKVIQRQMRNESEGLIKKGVRFHGTEGISGPFKLRDLNEDLIPLAVTRGNSKPLYLDRRECFKGRKHSREYIESLEDSYGRGVQSPIAIECIYGSDVYTFGAEDPKLLQREIKLIGERKKNELLFKLGRLSVRDNFIYHMKYHYELIVGRGKAAANRFVKAMRKKKKKVGLLTYGAGHLYELQDTLDKAGVNYVFVM